MISARSSVLQHAWLTALLLSVPALGMRAVAAPAPRPLDAAARVDFTITGDGHQDEHVHIRDAYPEVPRPYARFYHSGIVFGEEKPILQLRTEKLGPKLWSVNFLVANDGTAGPLPVTSAQPIVIYNGDNTTRQHAWFASIILPPLKTGTLAVTLSPGSTPGRVRGTFAGTLVDDAGNEATITNGTFDLARLPDIE